jgi:C1A family cysteine protease
MLSFAIAALALPLASEFSAWKAEFKKAYDTVEAEAAALAAYEANDVIIREHNAKKLSYWLGHNEFSDLTWDQFNAYYMESSTALHMNRAPTNMQRAHIQLPKPVSTVEDDDSVDWVEKGAVTPVKNQGRCGSCWAFSTTGSTEGAFFVASGKLVSLSEEDLVQCDTNKDQGCHGGLMDNAFAYIEKNGIATEADYPYTSGTGEGGTCMKPQQLKKAVTISGFKDVPADDEDALKDAVTKAPVSIAIEADKSAFQLYKSGVLDSSACGKKLDHGVLIVGYGTDSSLSKDYWKVKNSWGATWGDNGFIKIEKGASESGGECGIRKGAVFPTVKSASNNLFDQFVV